jgi:hypothetical protein
MYIHVVYIWFIYGDIGREITKHTVMSGVYLLFWPTLPIRALVQVSV